MRYFGRIIVFLIAITGFIFITPAMADVPPWFIEEMENHEVILEPGTTTYCQKDFVLENMGSEIAHVQVILGNGANYAFDRINPGEKMNYSLTGDYPLSGGFEGVKNSHIAEARIVNGSGHALVKVYCK